ncbi:MAG TPA: hypothetical protein VK772_03760 [Puia sp.]|nr:hypothetical protein [Puia sp.]
MKINRWLPFILVLTISCHSPAIKPENAPLKINDSTTVISHPALHHENDSAVILKTHLKDTTYSAGNFILFLQPDDNRYAELEKMNEDEVGDVDGDFGAGISGTEDSLKKNVRYKDIKILVSTKRYVCINDCKDGPLIIDRDTVNYGYILSAPGRPIAKTYNSVHSGDYLGELEEYFFLH